jgi:hypothetical protein
MVRKREELHDMSNKKYSGSVWKEKLWGQTGEGLKKIPQVPILFTAHFEVSHSIITEVLTINKQR